MLGTASLAVALRTALCSVPHTCQVVVVVVVAAAAVALTQPVPVVDCSQPLAHVH